MKVNNHMGKDIKSNLLTYVRKLANGKWAVYQRYKFSKKEELYGTYDSKDEADDMVLELERKPSHIEALRILKGLTK